MLNDKDANDYAEESGQLSYQRRLERMLINNDPFYPQAFHEQDIREEEVEHEQDGR